uniref:Uncharacterized protein n=1 Tax=Meloidogyne incognita TaxID=6306 RepID=A0A914MR80_MELIC
MHPGEGPSGSQPGGMHPGEGPSGSQPGGMHPGEGPSGSQPGGMHPGEGSGSQPRVMYQGEGPSGSQPVEEDEFTQIKGLIFPLLETVGNHEILQEIVPRPLRGPIRNDITNVREQYFNLVYAYIELFNTNAIIEQKNSLLEYLNQNMNNPNFTQKQHEEAIKNMNELESYLQINETLKNGLTADMRALYNYVQIIYNQTIRNLGEGPSGSQPGGMNPGEGSGSQLPVEPDMKQLDLKIRHMLQYVGSSAPLPGITPHLLKNQGNIEVIDNIGKQYNNLIFAYNELYEEFTNIRQQIQAYDSVKSYYQV